MALCFYLIISLYICIYPYGCGEIIVSDEIWVTISLHYVHKLFIKFYVETKYVSVELYKEEFRYLFAKAMFSER